MKKTRIPSYVRSCLWSCGTKSPDIKAQRKFIIEQVLNYGLTPAIKWLFKTYPEFVIKRIVASPSRGSWLPEVLTFWSLMFRMRLAPEIYWRAVAIPDPHKCQRIWKKYNVDPFPVPAHD